MSGTDKSGSTEVACWDKPRIGYLYIFLPVSDAIFRKKQQQIIDLPNDGKQLQKHE